MEEALRPNRILKMRSPIKVGAAVLLSLSFVGVVAAADDHAFREKWAEVEANSAIFSAAAERLGLTSSWSQPQPVRVVFRPPATNAEVHSVEAAMGEPLPESLRRFFLDASAGVDILWLIPGEIETPLGGVVSVRYGALPPPPWQRSIETESSAGRQTIPVVNGGLLNFSLDMMPSLMLRAHQWKQQFRREAEAATDPAKAAQFMRYAEFWERGLPLSSEGKGGILAVDRLDPEGRLMFLFHDSKDAPGWFLDQKPIDFMLTQSRLGFPGIGKRDLLSFGRERLGGSPMAELYAKKHSAEAEQFNLTLPAGLLIETNSSDAEIWRAWLGL